MHAFLFPPPSHAVKHLRRDASNDRPLLVLGHAPACHHAVVKKEDVLARVAVAAKEIVDIEAVLWAQRGGGKGEGRELCRDRRGPLPPASRRVKKCVDGIDGVAFDAQEVADDVEAAMPAWHCCCWGVGEGGKGVVVDVAEVRGLCRGDRASLHRSSLDAQQT
eukprot:366047-Chlamydomonas_euryale.AAC.8